MNVYKNSIMENAMKNMSPLRNLKSSLLIIICTLSLFILCSCQQELTQDDLIREETTTLDIKAMTFNLPQRGNAWNDRSEIAFDVIVGALLADLLVQVCFEHIGEGRVSVLLRIVGILIGRDVAFGVGFLFERSYDVDQFRVAAVVVVVRGVAVGVDDVGDAALIVVGDGGFGAGVAVAHDLLPAGIGGVEAVVHLDRAGAGFDALEHAALVADLHD